MNRMGLLFLVQPGVLELLGESVGGALNTKVKAAGRSPWPVIAAGYEGLGVNT